MKKFLSLLVLLTLLPLSSFAFATQNNSTASDPRIGIYITGDKGDYNTFIYSGQYDKGWYLNDTIVLEARWTYSYCTGSACGSERSTIVVPPHALVCVTGNYDNDRHPTLSIGDC